MKRGKNKPMALRVRRPVPPPGFSFRDRKKEANRRACRGRVREDR